jgi:muramidase (phage lysozyme)
MDQPNIFNLDIKSNKPLRNKIFQLDITDTPEKVKPKLKPDATLSFETMQKKLRDWIGDIESNGDYNVRNGGTHFPDKPLTEMSLGSVLNAQKSWRTWPNAESAAVGKYQFIIKTLRLRMKQTGTTSRQIFDVSTQDKLCNQSLKSKGINSWWQNKITDRVFLDYLSNEWASLPDPATGKSKYGNVKNNKALISTAECLEFLRSLKET